MLLGGQLLAHTLKAMSAADPHGTERRVQLGNQFWTSRSAQKTVITMSSFCKNYVGDGVVGSGHGEVAHCKRLAFLTSRGALMSSAMSSKNFASRQSMKGLQRVTSKKIDASHKLATPNHPHQLSPMFPCRIRAGERQLPRLYRVWSRLP